MEPLEWIGCGGSRFMERGMSVTTFRKEGLEERDVAGTVGEEGECDEVEG